MNLMDLQQELKRPLDEKIKDSKEIIKQALAIGEGAISYSGGKDSEVIKHLIESINPHVITIHANTGVEAKETREHIKTHHKDIQIVKFEKSFWKCWDEYGPPTLKNQTGGGGHGNNCCKYLKHRPLELWHWCNGVRVVFQGITVEESRQRAKSYLGMLKSKGSGHLYNKALDLPKYLTKTEKPIKSDIWVCHPIWNWTEKDVWDYIKLNNLPYNSRYDMGAKRVGCEPCTAYLSWIDQLAIENPKLLTMVLKKMGQSQLLNYIKTEPCQEEETPIPPSPKGKGILGTRL